MQQAREDEQVISNPQLAAMRADFLAYQAKIDVTLSIIAYRSTIYFGLAVQCSSTHFLDMKFVWDPNPERLCRRFQLDSADVRPFADANYSLPDEFVRMRTFEEEQKRGFSSVTTRMVASRQADLASPGAPSFCLRRSSIA